MAQAREGVVSVVLVNFRGVEDTLHAIDELGKLDWPADRLEIVVVENASGDESGKRLRALEPRIAVIESKENLGFAGGCNLGVARSSGEYIALLNNDARPHPQWIRAAMAVFESSPNVGAVASRVLDWEGEHVDFTDAALTWYGMGYKPKTTEPYRERGDVARNVLFGTGSAMFVRRSAFEAVGGFDDRYFMFFEDVDLGWRLNLAGWEYRYEPGSLAYHKHHASMAPYGAFKESYLLERNALFTLYKNLGDAALARALPAALALSVRRGMARGNIDTTQFDLRRGSRDDEAEIPIAKAALTGVFAIDQFVEDLPGLVASRAAIQQSRVVSDTTLRRLFRETDVPAFENDRYLDGYEHVVEAFDVISLSEHKRILIITGDPIGAKMAGPAIRAWNMAHALAAEHVVTVVSLSVIEAVQAPFVVCSVKPGDDRAMRRFVRDADMIIFQGHALELFASLRKTDRPLVADVYDPMHFEQLEQSRALSPKEWRRHVREATASMNEQFALCDYFICASDRQRHLYLGQMAALGRINIANYADDSRLDSLISIVPFGIEDREPVHSRNVLKGVHPSVAKTDKVILWSGGLYNWFDPVTLITAVARLSNKYPNVKLFFLGTGHPHPGVPEMGIVAEARAAATQLGVNGTNVVFNDTWVPYRERENFLLEADVGVSTHYDHAETTFSFRTRILDYLWATLPMVVTAGDSFADLIARERLGLVVAEGDVEELEMALERVLFEPGLATEMRKRIASAREQFRWDRVLQPVLEFARTPHRAADLAGRSSRGRVKVGSVRRRRGVVRDVTVAWRYLRTEGLTSTAGKAWRAILRRLGLGH